MSESLFDTSPSYEYGIVYETADDAPHRSRMTEQEARLWIAEWVEDGGRPEAVALIRRYLGTWERP